MDKNKESKTFPQMEQETSDFWDKSEIFLKSLEKEAPSGDFVFYDGPPFATGLPHYGHIVASTMKDVIPRYKTMRGFRVERKWGWDCHGLPIENIAEKELGSKNKKDIEAMGVEKFNEICRSKVLEYVEGWKMVIRKLGRWADVKNDYKTMDLSYMESVWWVFKELWDKGLIYEGYRSMHVCPRCETTLSQMEVSEGYKNIKNLSAIAKFELVDDSSTDLTGSPQAGSEQDRTFILAWTTTPWTLIGNVALAVGEDIDYVKVKVSQCAGDQEQKSEKYEYIILAKARLEAAMKEGVDYEAIEEFKGSDLISKKYKPPFDYYYNNANLPNRENGWKIYAGDFVTTTEGTGIVHIAPAFGEDDLEMGKKYSLPFIQHVGMDGVIKSEAKDFAGLNVKPIDDSSTGSEQAHQKTDIEIIKYLAGRGLLFSKEKYEHSYSHCWRCDTPLINYATSSWFVNILKIKADALEFAKEINWFPAHIKEGRFGKWLEGARDWSISRQRFWASVMPIWKCKCGEMKVFGSVVDLEKASGQKITDIHKHIVDKIKFPCEKCGSEMSRIPDVLDTWFDSGSMPYAQMHYPFENKEKFEKNFPAEFIAEGPDQTRAWFYYLHVIGTAIRGKNAFKNVIVNGIVLAEDGKKMSKKLQNYPDPALIMEKYGADALRFYLLSSPVVAAEDLNFSEKGVEEALRKNVMTLWNVYKFYELFVGDNTSLIAGKELNVADYGLLDKWILARLNELVARVSENLDGYNLAGAARPMTEFIDDLSTWYLRRSRDRFKSENEQEKKSALEVLGYVLTQTSKVIAPFMPFIAENIWQKTTGNNFSDNGKSVHLEKWPSFVLDLSDKLEAAGNKRKDVLEKMSLIRKIVEASLAERKNKGIKIRQVLQSLTIKGSSVMLAEVGNDKDVIDLIKDELNIKEIKFVDKEGGLEAEFDTIITPELQLEGLSREVIRTVNSIRKESGLSVDDSAELYYSGNELNEVFDKFGKDILRETLCVKYEIVDIEQTDTRKEIMIGDNKIMVGIKIKPLTK